MEYAYSILMLGFAGLILCCAGMLFIFPTTEVIPRASMAKIRDEKAYARQFAKLLAMTAAAPLVSALASLWIDWRYAIVILFFVLLLVLRLGRGLVADL